MEKEFIGKNVRINVLFSEISHYGAEPGIYTGIMKDVDDSYVKLAVSGKKNIIKTVLINKKQIIYIEEM